VLALEKAGLSKEAAETITTAVTEAQNSADLVTKKDLELALARLAADELAPIKSSIRILQSMIGFVLAGVGALVLKAFFLS